MRISALVHRVRERARNFRHAEDGNVAMIFTIALIPILGLVGGAVDYTRASSVRTAMQAALDATALAMSREAASISAAELKTKAEAYFKAAFNRPEAENIKIDATYSKADASSVTVTASGDIGTAFLGVLGIDTIPIGSSAKTVWGMGKVRVALVLDNSGSMGSGGRMTALKYATKDLLKTLEKAATSPGDVHVAIVPFNKNVNVGSSNYNQTWIDWEEWDEENGSCSLGLIKTKSQCLKLKQKWTAKSHDSWNGCVADRDQDYDVKNTTPSPSDEATLFPAVQASPCPESIMALSYDWGALKAKVEAMNSDGWTNQPIGLVWGWLALSTTTPMNAPAINDKKTQQFIILLSDGNNTQNRWWDGWGAESKINDRQKKVCDNIKADGIQIYSVLLIEGNESVMKDCASKPEMFYHLTSSDQVVDAFKDIGTKISKLRIAQ